MTAVRLFFYAVVFALIAPLGCDGGSETLELGRRAMPLAPFEQASDGDGIISIEAEHFHLVSSQSGHTWSPVSSPSGYSGTGALQALPDSGVKFEPSEVANSPRVDFQINFVKTGTHYLWVRGSARNSAADSCHAGLDGALVSSADRITLTRNWGWTRSTLDGPYATINVTAAGLHTVNVWMREDGAVIDKIVLTTNSTYVPSGYGPAETLSACTPDCGSATCGLDPVCGVSCGTCAAGASCSSGQCSEANCGDATDNDGDGATDCGDADCTGATCNDGDICTTGDMCGADGCAGTPITQCSLTSDGCCPAECTSATDADCGGGEETQTAFQQDAGTRGLVSMEAEHNQSTVARGNDTWTTVISPPGYSGTAALQALPDDGTKYETGFATSSPQIDFVVNFVKTGTHYVWLRGYGPNSLGDSCHAGLDGAAVSTANKIYYPSVQNWVWSRSTMDGPAATINVPTPGLHTLNIWVREDGIIVDKVVLTTDSSFVPTGTGPAESPLQGGSPEPEPQPDAGADAGAEAGDDAGTDADAGAEPDAGMDAEVEAGDAEAAPPTTTIECDPDFPRTGLELYVDANNGGLGDGSASRPFRTIGSAMTAATTGSVIHVARGTYAESVKVRAGINLMLLGGYAGGSSQSYHNGLPGVFSDRSPAIDVTRIQGNGAADGISAIDVRRLVVDGFWISGASHGVFSRYDWTISVRPQLFVCSNVLEENGQASGSHRGAGIYARDAYLTVLSNVIRNNVSGRGAAISFIGPQATIASNTIESNVAHGDHGGGLQIAGAALIKNNIIRNNEVGRGLTYGWGGGLIIFNAGTNARVTGNTIAGNIAPSIGGGIFVDDRAVATLDHNLVIRNQTRVYYKGGAGIYVDGLSGQGSTVMIENCTVAYNTGNATSFGNGVYVEGASSATITSSIFWGNGNDDFFSAAERSSDTSSIAISYTLSAEVLGASAGGIIAGAGNLSTDPLFASAADDDYHLRSRGGRWLAGTWIVDAEHSLAIDRGDPDGPFALEPLLNGGRINMGAYGGTLEASKSQ